MPQNGAEGSDKIMISANISNARRREVYRRDGYACALCGDVRHLQIHHILHRSEGGTDDAWNLITLCDKCHAIAHGHTFIVEDYMTQGDAEQAINEYMADLYARQGLAWNPWAKEGLLPLGRHYRRTWD